MLLLYFIARSHPEIESAAYRTLDATPLTFVRHEGLVAAVRLLATGGRTTPERMLEYNGILAAAARRAGVLPVRFGTGYRSEAAVARLLAGRRRELLEALDRLAGKSELGARVALDQAEQAGDRAAELARIAGALDTWYDWRPDSPAGAILEVALLVPSEEAARCRERLETEIHAAAGPRPPLHFLPQFLRAPVRSERRISRARAALGSAG